jgi:hypothetical protein
MPIAVADRQVFGDESIMRQVLPVSLRLEIESLAARFRPRAHCIGLLLSGAGTEADQKQTDRQSAVRTDLLLRFIFGATTSNMPPF